MPKRGETPTVPGSERLLSGNDKSKKRRGWGPEPNREGKRKSSRVSRVESESKGTRVF